MTHELIIDNFAGGGGASTGIAAALGRSIDVAINHNAEALAMHAANHPHTAHYCESVWDVDPLAVTKGQPTGLVWLSPDCKHFSKAKGGKPVEKKIRGLAWVALRWAAKAKPRVIMLENVEEFKTWGPLQIDALGNARPDPSKKGQTFSSFVRQLRGLGYAVDWRELRACDYGTPTIRKRFFMVARCDGLPIVWPRPTHGAPGSAGVASGALQPWATAASCIDFSLPCPSIFERKRPLADATLRRIAKGIMRYVVQADEPFIVGMCHTGRGDGGKVRQIHEPLSTITSKAEHLLIAPTLVQSGYGERRDTWRCGQCSFVYDRSDLPVCGCVKCGSEEDAVLTPGQAPRALDIEKPLGTVVGGAAKHALVSAFLAKHYTGVVGSDMAYPIGTVTAVDHHSLVTTNLIKLRGDNVGQAADAPLATISAQGTHHAEVRAFLLSYYGTDQAPDITGPLATVTCRDRFGMVTIRGLDYQIVDIGLRMLTPRELYHAQGFPADYIIGDQPSQGLTLTKSAQVRMCGNSVCPQLSEALVRANYGQQQIERQAA